MVQVRVNVSNLAIDVNNDGIQEIFKRGIVFDCPTDRAARLGNSVTILDIPPVIAEPEPNPPDIVEEITTVSRASTTRKNRR